jgi:hypothetical protein
MADLIIRGMEMPQNGYECPMNSFGICHVATDGENCECYDVRPDWCPLVQIPEGHGDLIEKKSAKAKFCQFCFWKHQNKDACERCAGCPIDFIHTIVPAEGETE